MSDRKNEHKIRSRLRRMILVRDGLVCQNCGRGPAGSRILARNHRLPRDWSKYSWLEIHHVNGDHRDPRPSNLATLCYYCHWLVTQQTGCAKACGYGIRFWSHDSLCPCLPDNRIKYSLMPSGKRVGREYRSRTWPKTRLYRYGDFYQQWLLRPWNRLASSRECRLARQCEIENEKRAENKWNEQAQGREFWLETSPSSHITYHSNPNCCDRGSRSIKAITIGREFVGKGRRFKSWNCIPCAKCVWWEHSQGRKFWLEISPFLSPTYHSNRYCRDRIERPIKAVVKGRAFVGKNRRFRIRNCNPCSECILDYLFQAVPILSGES
jgi:hypothetical protein